MKEYEVHIDEISSAAFGPPSARGSAGAPGKAKDAAVVVGLPPENKEVVVELRDPETLTSFKARAMFSTKPEEHPDWDKVWFVRTPEGRLGDAWAVKVIEQLELEEEERDVTALPTRRLSLGERKGRMLIDMLKEREEQLKKKGRPGPPGKPS